MNLPQSFIVIFRPKYFSNFEPDCITTNHPLGTLRATYSSNTTTVFFLQYGIKFLYLKIHSFTHRQNIYCHIPFIRHKGINILIYYFIFCYNIHYALIFSLCPSGIFLKIYNVVAFLFFHYNIFKYIFTQYFPDVKIIEINSS